MLETNLTRHYSVFHMEWGTVMLHNFELHEYYNQPLNYVTKRILLLPQNQNK